MKIFNEYKKLDQTKKAMIWYTFSNVLIKSVALLSTPIFTRLMTTSEFGKFTIFQSWLSILIIVTSLNMFQGGYTKGLIAFEDDSDGFTSASMGLVITVTFFWIIIYFCAYNFWNKFFELTPLLMIFMGLNLLFMPVLEFWSARLRFEYRYKEVVFISIVISVSSVLLGIILVMLNNNYRVEARALADLLARVVICGLILISIFKKGKIFYNKTYWKYNLSFNIPLLPHFLAFYILNQSDRLMISKMIGNTQAAYYSVAYTISMMMNLIMSALNSALTPFIYKSINNGKNADIRKGTTFVFILMAMLCIVTMAFAPEIITIFAGKNYADAVYVVPPIAASVYFIFVYSMFSTVEYYYQKTVRIAVATSVSAVVNVVLNYYLINIYGYYAAGYTTLISYMILTVMHYIFYKAIVTDKLGKNVELYNMKVIVICSIFVLVTMLFMIYIYKEQVIRYSVILAIVVVCLFNFRKIRLLFSDFKK